MTAGVAQAVGAAGALGLALVVVGRGTAWRLGGLAAWAAGCVALAAWLAPPAGSGLYAVVVGGGAAVATLLAVAFLRVPWALPLAVLACAPASIPVSVGQASGHLLAPLYLVVGGAALALGWRLFWEDGRAVELGPLAWPLALLVGWSGLALLWSADARRGATVLVLYVLPFGLLAAAIARLPWRSGWVAALYVELALLGLAFAAIGIRQYTTRDLHWTPTLATEDATLPSSWFYRVDSIFRDPSAYGRFLVVAILASTVVILFGRPRAAWAALAATLVIFAGLLPSFSQSSYVALAAGIVVALVVAWGRLAILPLAACAAAVAAVALGVPQAHDRIFGASGVRHATSERWAVVSDGLELARDRPLAGVGTGGFRRAYEDRHGAQRQAPAESTPVTVAGELGVPGVALLTWLAGATLFLLFRGRPLDRPTRSARTAFGLALLVLVVESVFHGSLLEDPAFWALLGLVAVSSRPRAAPPQRAPQHRQRRVRRATVYGAARRPGSPRHAERNVG